MGSKGSQEQRLNGWSNLLRFEGGGRTAAAPRRDVVLRRCTSGRGTRVIGYAARRRSEHSQHHGGNRRRPSHLNPRRSRHSRQPGPADSRRHTPGISR